MTDKAPDCPCGGDHEPFVNDGKSEERWAESMENACPYCGGSGHKDDIRADLHVKVKPLEWKKGEFKLKDGNTYTSVAHTPFGVYYASELIWFGPGVVVGHGSSETNCQEHAQDTYEFFVNMTLEPAPITPAQAAEVLGDALDAEPATGVPDDEWYPAVRGWLRAIAEGESHE